MLSIAAHGIVVMTTPDTANDDKISTRTLHFRCRCTNLDCHYNDVTLSSWRIKSSATRVFVQKLVNFDNKENNNTPYYWQLDSSHKGPVTWTAFPRRHHVDGLVQNCSNSAANALELLQSCTEPSKWMFTRRLCWNDHDVQILHLYSTVWKYDSTWYVYWKQIFKSESCDDANFSSLGAPQVVITTTSGATTDEKSGTMTRFQRRCQSYHYHTPQYRQATVLDARASRVKWPAQFMSHWYGILFTE